MRCFYSMTCYQSFIATRMKKISCNIFFKLADMKIQELIALALHLFLVKWARYSFSIRNITNLTNSEWPITTAWFKHLVQPVDILNMMNPLTAHYTFSTRETTHLQLVFKNFGMEFITLDSEVMLSLLELTVKLWRHGREWRNEQSWKHIEKHWGTFTNQTN